MGQCLLGRLHSASAAMLAHRRADELGAGSLQMGWTARSAGHPLQQDTARAECAGAPAAAKKKPEKNPPHSPNTSRLQPLSREMLAFFASRWALQQLSPWCCMLLPDSIMLLLLLSAALAQGSPFAEHATMISHASGINQHGLRKERQGTLHNMGCCICHWRILRQLHQQMQAQSTSRCILSLCCRGISPATLERNGVQQEVTWMPGAANHTAALAFPYCRNGEVVNIKYRTLNKQFRQVGTAATLYSAGRWCCVFADAGGGPGAGNMSEGSACRWSSCVADAGRGVKLCSC